MRFAIEEAVLEAFPQHGSALLRVTGSAPLRPRSGALAALVQSYHASDQATMRATAYWRTVFAAMGAKPKYGPSIEKLNAMQHAKGGRLPIPIEIVLLYCWFSLVHGVPMAGYRPERIAGTLRLSMPGAGVPFTALGQANGSQEKTKPREVAYVDDEKAICRYWNYRDCDQAKLVEGVRDVLFVFDLVNAKGMLGTSAAPELCDRFAGMLEGPVTVSATTVSAAAPAAPAAVLP